MKRFCTKMTICLAFASGFALCQAQEMTAEKKASDLSDVIKPTAWVSARSYVLKVPDGADDHYLQVRTIFGANILKDKYVLTFESRYNNPHNSAQVVNTVNYFTLSPRSYKIGALALGGYFQEVMVKGQPTVHVVAPNADLTKDFGTSVGTFKGEAYLEGDYMLSGQPSKATYKSSGPSSVGLGLAKAAKDEKSGQWQGDKHKPDLYAEFDQIGTFTPSRNKELSFMVTNYMRSNFNEVVTVDDEGSVVSSKYAQSNDVETIFTLAYKLTDNIVIASDTGIRRDGFYAKRALSKNKEDYYTLLRLDATLL